MLKSNKIEVFISYRNITHYIKLGYNPILNENLTIDTRHLPSNSHFRVDAICELCKSEINIRYHKYLENRSRHNFYSCKKCSRQKAALTSMNKYGVDNYSKTNEYKKRVEATNIEKYGYKTNLISPEYKIIIKNKLKKTYGTENFYEINRFGAKKKNNFTMNDEVEFLKKEFIYSEDLYDESKLNDKYILYRNEVRRLTKANIKELIETWNGLDYYDDEYIKENWLLNHNDPKYPTIDHKISIYHGFKSNIPHEEISNISNLCITKRSINSIKRDLIESEFQVK